jgi:hypothetical protein
MKERPILFSAPMVTAILAGKKTQTRRIADMDKLIRADVRDYGPDFDGHEWSASINAHIRCPYGAPGGRLWVRETWGLFDRDSGGGSKGYGVAWRATHPNLDDAVEWIDGPVDYGYPEAPAAPSLVPSDNWRPSIHMPRWASRLTLEVTSVRVERLHDISESDALAEGCSASGEWSAAGVSTPSARADFGGLWRSINGVESWAANPWVWVVGFTPTAAERAER